MEYYVYVWRDAAQVPFYVGKGKGKRAYRVGNRSKEFKEIHAQGGCSVEIIDWFMHESQAHAHEVELIAAYGRRCFGGLLVNKTDGGEGASGANFVRSAETRAKLSAAHVGKVISPETRAKMSEIRKGRSGKPHSEETIAKLRIVASNRGPETRAKISAAASNRSAETLAKMSAAQKGKTITLEQRKKRSDTQRLRPAIDGYKGVSFHKASNKWRSHITLDYKQKHIGLFVAPDEAAKAYDRAAVDAWGLGNCYLNFPEEFSLKEAA